MTRAVQAGAWAMVAWCLFELGARAALGMLAGGWAAAGAGAAAGAVIAASRRRG